VYSLYPTQSSDYVVVVVVVVVIVVVVKVKVKVKKSLCRPGQALTVPGG